MTMRSIAAMMKQLAALQRKWQQMKDSFDITEFVSVDNVRDEIDELMTEKLRLTPPIVKKLMEDVIREHLGWLIIWGNIFGGGLGIISHIGVWNFSLRVEILREYSLVLIKYLRIFTTQQEL